MNIVNVYEFWWCYDVIVYCMVLLGFYINCIFVVRGMNYKFVLMIYKIKFLLFIFLIFSIILVV